MSEFDELLRAARIGKGWTQEKLGSKVGASQALEREVKQGLRRTLLKYQLHQDAELFEKAYGYIKQYY